MLLVNGLCLSPHFGLPEAVVGPLSESRGKLSVTVSNWRMSTRVDNATELDDDILCMMSSETG